jgi:hypothetical protein
MYGFIFAGLMLVQSWSDLQVGDCLSVPEMQSLSKVQDTFLYSGGQCNRSYDTSAVRIQRFACGVELEAGRWDREMVRHKEAGVFWPSPVPCAMSVKSASNRRLEWEPLGDIVSCEASEFRLKVLQEEQFTTKAFSAGQGTLYLPYPFTVTRKEWIPAGEDELEFCERSQVWIEYTGWGSLRADVHVKSCDGLETRFCQKAKLSVSENDAGEQCLEITQMSNCKN